MAMIFMVDGIKLRTLLGRGYVGSGSRSGNGGGSGSGSG